MIRSRSKSAPQHLPNAHEHQRNKHEKRPREEFDRHDERGDVACAVFGTEIHLLRRTLPSDIDHHRPEVVVPPERAVCEDDGKQEKRHDNKGPLSTARRSQAADRHPEKCGQQHDVGEEREEHHRAAEPSNAGEFEKQQKKTDEKQLGVGSPARTNRGPNRPFGACHVRDG
jgi:hypothetical protein